MDFANMGKKSLTLDGKNGGVVLTKATLYM